MPLVPIITAIAALALAPFLLAFLAVVLVLVLVFVFVSAFGWFQSIPQPPPRP